MKKQPEVGGVQPLYKKQCKFVGSVAIPPQHNHEERQQFISEKIGEMTDGVRGIPVVLMILEEGVKVLKEDGSAVKMAHSVTRIMFSTSQPERKLFAYVAKTMNVSHRNVVQAHIFKTKKTSHTKELNASLSKAFKLSLAKATALRKEKEKTFNVETPENRETKIKGKRWAKQELAMGHKYAEHAQYAQRKTSQQVDEKVEPNKSDQKAKHSRNEPPNLISSKEQGKTPSKGMQKQLPDGNSTSKEVASPERVCREKAESPDGSANDNVYQEIKDTNSEGIYQTAIDSSQRPVSGDQRRQRKSDVNSPGRIISAQRHESRQEDILTLTLDSQGSKIIGNPRQPANFVSPAQRFSTIASSPTEEINFTPTKFEGYVNVDVDKKNEPLPPLPDHHIVDKENEPLPPLPDHHIVDKENEPLPPLPDHHVVDKKDEPLPPLPDEHREKKGEPLPPLPDNAHAIRESQMFEMTEDDILKNVEWFQAGFSREIAESVLSDRSIGAFFVRASQTQLGSYVLTVKIPVSVKPNGIGNFLIEVTNGEYKLKGFKSVFCSLTDLVAHYGSCKEDIPVQLYLGTQNQLCEPEGPKDGQADAADDSDEEFEDPDYQYFTSADGMLKELASL